jgi:hypothetical protein
MAGKGQDESRAVESAPLTIVLVACSKKKGKGEARAEDLYTSALFRKARTYAERRGDRWYILSALHGLTEPGQLLAPYNVTLRSFTRGERQEWARRRVMPRLIAAAPAGSKIVILAGRTYFEYLEGELISRGYRVEIPMRGMDIYAMMRFLKEQNEGAPPSGRALKGRAAYS